MLLSGWNMDEALAVSKEEGFEDGLELGIMRGMAAGRAEGVLYGEKTKQEELIRKFSQNLSPEDIAETLSVSKAYVLDVLRTEGYVCEPGAKYEVNTNKEK